MLKDKVAVITGSTSGIGEGCARALAKEGCNLVINGFGDAAEIDALRSSFESEYGVKCLYSPADMTKPDEIAAMFDLTVAEFGGVDILINNAGIQYVAPIAEFPVEKWDAIIAINLTSAFHTMHHAIPLMTKRGWGRIINTASAHALVASPNKSAYVAAKHGIAGLTKTAALEVAKDNITVNAICPGYVWTPLVEKQIPDTAKTRGITEEEVINDVLLAAAATKKFTTIEQVAALALFLCGDAAENITGSLQSIDGGWTAQ
ncbi:3-hydroxybutyrate dehydrogenase [uncultured Sneathiella sp.]|uniref:3-hydroxybutyrate dehydrogenase n=1 Tax=uncultured Sneathiella sp. TaxID=879315 RepID=UPI0030EB6BAF|tara:strand:- start:10876 stop:11658 length:783 start_codon:yes stop_codon:yes gene_type:complete